MSTHPTDPASPAVQTGECINSGDDAEWRDLQNAQLLSMQTVWDNPEDEVWSSISPDAYVVAQTPRRAQLRQAQAMFQQRVPAGAASVVDELIAQRRAEVDSE